MTGIAVFARDDVVLVPIQDLGPAPLGLIWCTARRSAKVRALADLARTGGSLCVSPDQLQPAADRRQPGDGTRRTSA